MGCDGYLSELDNMKLFTMTCYICNKPIDLAHPRTGHNKCTDERNGKEILRVNIDIDDYEGR